MIGVGICPGILGVHLAMFLGHMGVHGWCKGRNGILQAILGFFGRCTFVRQHVPYFLERYPGAAGAPGTLTLPPPTMFG